MYRWPKTPNSMDGMRMTVIVGVQRLSDKNAKKTKVQQFTNYRKHLHTDLNALAAGFCLF